MKTITFFLSIVALCHAQNITTQKPKLVLMITVDQLRGDVPDRFAERFGGGGFRYLLEEGIHYTNAHYSHFATYTAPGHATIFSGAHGRQHGVVGNKWYDRNHGEPVYCAADTTHAWIGEATKRDDGTSPANLLASTIGDELIRTTAGASQVYAISIKDRGAIFPAGHDGIALWYSPRTGRVVSSSYYFESNLPDWLTRWNKRSGAARYSGRVWRLFGDAQIYQQIDARPEERPKKGLDNLFPHPLGLAGDGGFFSRLRYTPFGDVLVVDLAQELIARKQLGQGSSTDLLAVSLSATDYIGHIFGPGSREAEDNVLRLDAALAELFDFVDRQVGLANTLLVLTSDHGVSPVPEVYTAGGEDGGRVDVAGMIDHVNERLASKFDISVDLVAAFHKPSLYLKREAIADLGLDLAEVGKVAAEAVAQITGVERAITASHLTGKVPKKDGTAPVWRSFRADRSGDILLVPKPFWIVDVDGNAATHGSAYDYDSHVPIFFAGHRVSAKRNSRRVAVADIASTVCSYLGIDSPNRSVGEPLVEVLAFAFE